METDETHCVMAAAVYEIRLLLANYLGSDCDADPDVRLAAHLSYALHNDASAIMNGMPHGDLAELKSRIKNAQEIAGFDIQQQRKSFACRLRLIHNPP